MSFENTKGTVSIREIRDEINELEALDKTLMIKLRIDYLKSRLMLVKSILLNLPLKPI